MSGLNAHDTARLDGRYAVSLGFATLSAGAAGLAWGVSRHLHGGDPLAWQASAVVAATIAAVLTADAMKKWRRAQGDPQARRGVAQPGGGSAKMLALPAPTKPQETKREDAAPKPSAQKTAVPDPRAALEGERARLQASGFSEGEISQILVARAAGGHGASPLGGGVATGLLNNLGAVAAYARSFLPGLKADLAHLFNSEASPATRSGAAVSLAFKAITIAVVAYVASLEFGQLQAMVAKTKAEACSARMKMIAETLPPSEWPQATAQYEKDCGV